MNKINFAFIPSILFLMLFLTSCVKDELIDFPQGTVKSIKLSPMEISVLVGEASSVINAEFSGLSTEEQNGTLEWISTNPSVATASEGIVSGVSVGQVYIYLRLNGLLSDSVLVNIGADVNNVAQVIILNTDVSLSKDSTLQFTAQTTNFSGAIVSTSSVTWTSLNTAIASVDGNGLLTALSVGSVDVVATVDGINSLPYTIQITDGTTGLSRMGALSGNSNYVVEGTVTLTQIDVSTLELSLSSDFSSSSGPGLYIYLASTSSGTIANGSNGYRVSGQLSGTDLMGARTYTIPTSEVMLNDFDFVVMYCEPFGITFGSATLN